jgi:metallophosphoesterase (TIGR00282 family)
MGNHTWRKKSLIPVLETWDNIVRPANYPAGTPGKGAIVLTLHDGRKLGLLNLLGRIYMEPMACPFEQAARAVEALHKHCNCILVDMHAEATSEKVAMGWFLDGKCSAVLGTHTHVQTADAWILPEGTGYVTDVGMCGPQVSVLGVKVERVINKLTTAMPHSFDVASGSCIFSAIYLDIDDMSGKTKSIEPILLRDPL